MWLSIEELRTWTEAKKRPEIEKWLDKNKVPYTVGSKGGIKVMRAYVEKMHGLSSPLPSVPRNTEPNLSAFPTRK